MPTYIQVKGFSKLFEVYCNTLVHLIYQDGADGTFALAGGQSTGAIALTKKLDYNFGQQQFLLNVSVKVSMQFQ